MIKTLLCIVCIGFACVYSIENLQDYMQTPWHVTVSHSSNPRIEKTLSLINNRCDNCIFKKGIYKTTISVAKSDLDIENALGVTTAAPLFCDISISKDMNTWDDRKLLLVILHEIGHCMGKEHEYATGTIMSPYYTDVPESQINFFLGAIMIESKEKHYVF